MTTITCTILANQ